MTNELYHYMNSGINIYFMSFDKAQNSIWSHSKRERKRKRERKVPLQYTFIFLNDVTWHLGPLTCVFIYFKSISPCIYIFVDYRQTSKQIGFVEYIFSTFVIRYAFHVLLYMYMEFAKKKKINFPRINL